MMHKRAWNTADNSYLARYMAGGAATGAGVSLVATLLHHMRTLADQRSEEERAKKDTLPIEVPIQKMAEDAAAPKPWLGVFGEGEPSAMAMAAAGPALLGSGLVGYHAVRRLYQKYQASEKAKDLENQQQAYHEALRNEARMNKLATGNPLAPGSGSPQTGSETATTLLMSSLGIPFAAAAVLAHTMLNKSYPKDRPSHDMKPITLAPQAQPEEEEQLKAANYFGPEFADRDDALEVAMPFLMDVVCSSVKSGSWIPDLVALAGSGGMSFIDETIQVNGWDGGRTMQMFKGAALNRVDTLQRMAGTALLIKSAMAGPSFQNLLAAEAFDMCPVLVKSAAHMPQGMQDWLIKYAALHTRARFQVCLEKSAGMALPPAQMAPQMQAHMNSQINQQQLGQDQAPGPGNSDQSEEPFHNLAAQGGESEDSLPDSDSQVLHAPQRDQVDVTFADGLGML